MCGIAGFIGEDRERIARITAALKHRGPDGDAICVRNGVSLGHARLAILDPSPLGDQPMWNDEKTIAIVYNGEIYNFKRLKEEENLQCKTGTDTEVLLKLYEKHGMRFVSRLLGMFAFAIHDTRDHSLHLARDPRGIKPLYLAYENGKPHFASEMRALILGLKNKPAIDLKSLSAFMRLQYVPGPRTLCEGIESVVPGTIISWKDGKETRTRFTTDTPDVRNMSRAAFRKDFPSLMRDVVEDHLVSDKPIGIFLSGGMDSSIVLHHMAGAMTGRVKTFTVRFDATQSEDAARFNRDADLAALTAAHYGTDHEELVLTADMYRSLYKETACALDLPNADSVAVAQYALARLAKKQVDVVLTGAGGDELFGGYPRYRVARILSMMRCVPPSLRSFAGRITGYPPDVLSLDPGPKLAERLLARPNEEIMAIARGDWFDPQSASSVFNSHFDRVRSDDDVRQMMEADRSLWLVDESLKLCDAVTMASGLECRVPFVDARVAAWSHATKSSWHVEWRRTKALLKDTYRPLLPGHVYSLDKASFYPPLAKWLRRECMPLMEEALQGKRIAEYFDVRKLRAVFDEHRTKQRYGLHQLSNIMQLHYWFETVYDTPPSR